MRVLHVVGQMNRGGAETWLMQVLRNLDPARARFDFLVTTGRPGHYDAEIAARGAKVIPCETPAQLPRFARRFLAVLREHGPYDVVHSHLHHFSGVTLALARGAGVPVRVAHSHLDTGAQDAEAGLRRRLYLRLMATALQRCATHGLAASTPAAAALFGERWREDARWRIARCSVDLGPFAEPADGAGARAELGVPADALVLGHVGRFDPQKNHALLLRIAAAVRERDPRAWLVLAGDGPLRAAAEADAARLGLRERAVFAGVRPDVPRLLRSFDVFVFPSLYEGLPIVGLEAQAAGLPIVISDRVTRELEVVPGLFTWRSPADPPGAWADAVLAAARRRPAAADAVELLRRSEFSLSRSLPELLAVYGCAA